MERQAIRKSNFLLILGKQRILLILIALLAITLTTIPKFGTVENVMKIMRQVSINGIIAIGMTFVIMTGGIDISVGSTLALGGIVAGIASTAWGLPLPVSIAVALLAGALIGMANGYFIAYRNMLPFVVTMGMMNVIRGMGFLITKGQSIWGLSESFLHISSGYVWFIPIPVIILMVMIALAHILLRSFSLGRYFLAVGGNEEATRLAGIHTKQMKQVAYILCGALAAGAGVVLASRLGTCQPTAGEGYELDAIASVVIGGTSLNGGVGSILGTLWGALIIGVVKSALNQLGVQAFWQTIAMGAIVIFAVFLDTLKKQD